MPIDIRTPVTIITGFLGSGKTTLLNRVLADPGMAGAAVIINEFGEIGLDHLLIATPNENTVLLASGCICCTVRGDLVDTLRNLEKQRRLGELPPFDRVLIETTGLADPVPIMQTIIADDIVAPRFAFDGVITLVDAVNGMAQLDAQPEAVKQAAVADRLLITKTDIAAPQAVHRLQERLVLLNPAASVQAVNRGEIAPAQLFGAAIAAGAGEADLARWLRERVVAQVEQEVAQHHYHDHIRAYSLYLDQPVSHMGMTAWLTALASLRGANLLRVKALLNVEGEPVAVHAVQTLIHEPVALLRWPDDERRSRLVFITRGMSRDEVESTLEVLRLKPAAAGPRTLDPRAYAQFVAAMKNVH